MGVSRILVLNYEYPPAGGGAGRATQGLCRAWAGLGLEVTVLTGHAGDLPRREVDHGVEVVRTHMLRRRLDRATPANMATYVAGALPTVLARTLGAKRPDVVHAHFALPTGPLALAARLAGGPPYVVTLHGGDVPGFVPEQTRGLFRGLKWAADLVLSRASAVVAVSEGLRQLARQSYRTPIEVIPNGLDDAWLASSPVAGNGTLRLAFAGRFTEQKNVLALVRACLGLPESLPWRLTLAGDGPLLPAARELAGGDSRVEFTGWLDESGVRAMLDRCDIFLLPSRSEGLSVAGLQALARGCALVASDIPMNRELVRGGNGVLCGLEPEQIRSAVLACREDLAGRRQASLALAREYAWRRIAPQYLELFARGRA